MSSRKFSFSLCPTGIVPTRGSSAHVPLTPAQIRRDVAACLEYGINSVHLHARDSEGANCNRAETYAAFVAAVREVSEDIVICVSCSGRIEPELEARSDVLSLSGDLRPDMASLTLGSLNFARSASLNAPDVIVGLARRMRERGIKPELEVFDVGMVNYAHYLISKGYLEPPYLFNIILGNPFTAQADPIHLGAILRELPADSIWGVGGIGRQQTAAVALGLASGGGVRIGLEDNLWFDRERTVPASNVSLVERAMSIASTLEREPMTPVELRSALGL